ncbi:Uncharacterised protein [Klebsiella michiganensis]|uniref:Uncharacterized protein n=1 Tax=Klebsiella michiganensis TaxID=1134687 RepID=A0A7H4MV71_9ENTR|nr:Uncharacterised protein [Klebsiella michiganensis]
MARITSGPFCVLRRLARAQEKNHRPLFFFIQRRLSGNLLRRRSPLIQMLDDKTGGDQLVYPAGQLAVLLFHPVGKPVADALALPAGSGSPANFSARSHLPASPDAAGRYRWDARRRTAAYRRASAPGKRWRTAAPRRADSAAPASYRPARSYRRAG